MMELTPKLIRKHFSIVEAQVKSYTRRSKTGKSVIVRAHERTLKWSSNTFTGEHKATAGHGGHYQIHGRQGGGFTVHHHGENGQKWLVHSDQSPNATLADARKAAEEHNRAQMRAKKKRGT